MKNNIPDKIRFSYPDTPLFASAVKVIGKLRAAGFGAYMVGGAVRDLCRGVEPDDIDLVTTARPEDILKIFPDAENVGACFGVVLIKFDGWVFETATCREDRGYSDGRRPDKVVYTDDFSLDVARRDFTVNALLYDPEAGEIIDYVGGYEDIERKIIRVVGAPEDRFREDYLRLLRAVRFAGKLGFELDEATGNAVMELAGLVEQLAMERVRVELETMLSGPDPVRSMKYLKKYGLLKYVLPEVDALAGVTQSEVYHPEGDVWVHTLLMLEYAAKPVKTDLAWCILLHDIGKVPTRTLGEDGEPHFYSHETVGAEMVETVAERLRFSNELRNKVVHAVRNHMRFASVLNMREAKLKRLLAEPDFELELELHYLDCKSSNGLMEGYEFLRQRRLNAPETAELPVPLVKGEDLIKLGHQPGKLFKEILTRVMDEQLDGNLTSREAALQFVLEHYPVK